MKIDRPKKLNLYRETVRSLTLDELKHIDGAGQTNGFTKKVDCTIITKTDCSNCILC